VGSLQFAVDSLQYSVSSKQ